MYDDFVSHICKKDEKTRLIGFQPYKNIGLERFPCGLESIMEFKEGRPLYRYHHHAPSAGSYKTRNSLNQGGFFVFANRLALLLL